MFLLVSNQSSRDLNDQGINGLAKLFHEDHLSIGGQRQYSDDSGSIWPVGELPAVPLVESQIITL